MSIIRNSSWIRFSIMLFILLFAVSFFGCVIHFQGLVFSDNLITDGIVNKYEKSNHSSVFYTYKVESRVYKGVGSAVGFKEGDKIKIKYSRKYPHKSYISDKIPSALSLILFTSILSLFVSIAATIIVRLGNNHMGTHKLYRTKQAQDIR